MNPDDGTIKWAFQFTPHDTHDWDANETVILFDAAVGGRERKLLAQANRNGFYYVLDRATGEFVAGTAFVKQTWADGLDAKGRPIAKKGLEPNAEGVLVYPSIQGAANWHSPSYSPKTNLFYQTAVEMGTIFYKGEAVYKPLWDTQLGANIRGIPVSFGVDGKQYVAIAAGFALFVYGLP